MRKFHRFRNSLLFYGLIFLMSLTLSSAASSGRKKLEVFVEPTSVRAGEQAYFVIRSNDGARNRPLTTLPSVPGLRWLGGMSQSSRISIVNGKRTAIYEVRIPFVAEKEGSYTIPPMILTNNKEKSPSFSFKVQKDTFVLPHSSTGNQKQPASGESKKIPEKGASLSLDQVLSMQLAGNSERKFYYLGEVIPLDLYINALQGISVQLSWPKLIFPDPASAILLDHRKQNPENPNYASVVRSRRTLENRSYESYRFTTAFRALTAGKITIHAEEQAVLLLPEEERKRSSSDDFFDDFWGSSMFRSRRRVTRHLKSAPLTLEIRKLPPVPTGVFFTGLVGAWKSNVTLSPPPYKAGEPLTVKVQFESLSSSPVSPDTLRIPSLAQDPHFRTYAPEVEKGASSCLIRYVLIPTSVSGRNKISLKLGPWATFDPVSARYVVSRFEKALVIEKGSSAILPGNSMPVVVDPGSGILSGRDPEKKTARTEEVLYLKRNIGRKTELPLWKNTLLKGIAILFAAIILIMLSVIFRLKRTLLENDPSYLRHEQAKKMKKALLKKIASLEPARIPSECSGDIASCLSHACDLPPGSDLAECAKALKERNGELAGMLTELSDCAWSPGKSGSLDEAFRSRLLKLLGKICLFAVILLPLSLPAAEAESGNVPKNNTQAMTAYDRGRFGSAAEYYKSLLRKNHITAPLLYNLGNCYYKMGKLHQALICYERALRLDGRDPDILENLNLVRRKLHLKERYRIQSPADTLPYMRDMLRLDEWLLMIFMGIGTLFAAAAYFIWIGDNKGFRLILSLGACWVILSFWAYLAQCKSIYDPDQALVMAQTLNVYSLPSEEAGKVEMKLRAGEEIHIEERRMEWIRIRNGNVEGWVRAKGIMPLWNGSTMQDLVSHQ